MERIKITAKAGKRTIEGEYEGSYKLYTFFSDDAYFKEHYPEGRLSSAQQYFNEPTIDQKLIFRAVEQSVDAVEPWSDDE